MAVCFIISHLAAKRAGRKLGVDRRVDFDVLWDRGTFPCGGRRTRGTRFRSEWSWVRAARHQLVEATVRRHADSNHSFSAYRRRDEVSLR